MHNFINKIIVAAATLCIYTHGVVAVTLKWHKKWKFSSTVYSICMHTQVIHLSHYRFDNQRRSHQRVRLYTLSGVAICQHFSEENINYH